MFIFLFEIVFMDGFGEKNHVMISDFKMILCNVSWEYGTSLYMCGDGIHMFFFVWLPYSTVQLNILNIHCIGGPHHFNKREGFLRFCYCIFKLLQQCGIVFSLTRHWIAKPLQHRVLLNLIVWYSYYKSWYKYSNAI